MDYLGNNELLNQPKTAFLASSTIPTDMVLRCYDWAQRVSREDICIISGFSSHLEQRVLHFLIKRYMSHYPDTGPTDVQTSAR